MPNSREPNFGPSLWLAALIVVCLSAKIDPATAGLIVVAIALRAVWRLK
ncbi:hypothetical protein [Bifidobacterium tibiigranuli]|jgi:hypothetical protein|nr:hypothetical protein [Bifidobacterium tibiigranuli]MCI1649778.1 hypothetical protein [Bifidobacterium tibiigranuli]MCI2186631.1 hypothetical protein [Bifidobacterium tibiigranuli]MCI2204237.1 hypothetical protein [Bifidobacterium tibiigranuli]